MRDESHLDEMRTAIRGDFERLAERRGEQELMRVQEEEVEPAVEAGSEPLEHEASPAPEPRQEVEPGVRRRSWLSRFLSP